MRFGTWREVEPVGKKRKRVGLLKRPRCFVKDWKDEIIIILTLGASLVSLCQLWTDIFPSLTNIIVKGESGAGCIAFTVPWMIIPCSRFLQKYLLIMVDGASEKHFVLYMVFIRFLTIYLQFVFIAGIEVFNGLKTIARAIFNRL